MTTRLHYDTTPAAVTVWCDCGWRELLLTPEAARRIGAEHKENVHPRPTGEAAAVVRAARAARDDLA